MQVQACELPGLRLIRPVRHGDARGWFSETYRADLLAQAGITDVFVQDNESLSGAVGTLRGLHFQRPPMAQAKLVRAVTGALLDVVVDLRRSSPTFGRHACVRLDAAEGLQLYVPEGFAHGFCTLEPDTRIAYKVNRPYSREHDAGIRWDDPALGIDWPVAGDAAILSDKDRRAPLLAEIGPVFA